MAQDDNDFFLGYIDEVQSYIPIIKKGVEELQTASAKAEIFDEVYRLVHIIKGASSMVGVKGMSQIAGCMESALDCIREGKLALSSEAFAAMGATADRFDQYCLQLRQGLPVEEEALLDQTVADFSKIGSGPGEPIMPMLDGDFLEEVEGLTADPMGFVADDELLGEFRAEAEEHLEELSQAMQYLESHIAGPTPISGPLREVVQKIRRSVHTVKRAAAVIGLSDLAAYGHLVEDVLDWLYESAASVDQRMVTLLSESLELLATLIYTPDHFDEQRAEQLLEQLNGCMHESGEGGLIEGGADVACEQSTAKTAPPRAVPAASAVPAGKQSGGSLQGDLFSEEEKQLLQEGFLEEAEEHFQQLHQSLQILQSEVDSETQLSPEHREEIRKIRRAVHTIKGASAVIGLNDIASFAHGVEDFLDWLYERAQRFDPGMVNTLAESVDMLGMLVESSETVTADRQADMHRRLSSFFLESNPLELTEELQSLAELPEAEELALADPVWVEKAEDAADAALSQATVAEAAKTIRINQSQLDTLINWTNELLVGVSGFDQNMGLFKNALNELELTTRRLKDIALELETKFEVKALDRLSEHFVHLDASVADVKTSQSFAEFDALELDRYTQLNLIIRSLNESAIDVAAINTNLGGIYSGIGGDVSRQHRVIRELQVQMMRTRMSPMTTLTSRLSRTMRDVASRLGKRVRLVVEGERVELDRVVWEKLADPFMHLIRNAVHHGVESEADRLARNKPAIATITLAGRREGNHIVLRFSDDGQGLDFTAIKEKARLFGLHDTVDQMDERQLTDLIFYPGFSTKTISEISGRGVGMDVVKENVKELQGSISVETERGVGTTFVIRAPLTLGVVRALLVRIGEVTYGIPLNDIRDIHRIEQNAISREEGSCQLAGATLPWYSLPALLGLGEEQGGDPRPLVLVLATEGRAIALSIPSVSGQKEVVLKGLGSHLRTVPGVSGAAVMGDGSIVPILDVPGLVEEAERAEHADAMRFQLEIPKTFTVMIVDDSISIRRVMSRLVTANGWSPVEAKDGLDAVEQLEMDEFRPDCIVLDIEMPRMNGFEFLAKLPNLPGGKDIPVIMLTSRTSSKHQEKAFQLGAKAFLNKPCKDEEFVEAVLRLTGGSAASAWMRQGEVVS